MSGGREWWRPEPGSKAEARVQFSANALGILTAVVALAVFAWSVISTDDGRMKALILWALGTTVAFAYVTLRVFSRENRETRYGRALANVHDAHHLLRDAAYARYIAQVPEEAWKAIVGEALSKFAQAFSIATGASCHATIKSVLGPETAIGEGDRGPESLEVETYLRSEGRAVTMRPSVRRNTVGHNTDFRFLFDPEKKTNRCWHHNDLLTLEGYDNPHWPEQPTVRNVPYRSTMVWPIRKVLREGTGAAPNEHYIHGFLTVDSKEPDVLVYERHFELGAGFADHLLSVLWNPEQLRRAHLDIAGNGS